jgi:hypothetical protein
MRAQPFDRLRAEGDDFFSNRLVNCGVVIGQEIEQSRPLSFGELFRSCNDASGLHSAMRWIKPKRIPKINYKRARIKDF